MTIDDFAAYARSVGHTVEEAAGGGGSYVFLRGVTAPSKVGGVMCDVGILRTPGNPWVPQTAIHVRPHLVAMGQKSSQASPLGGEWQYLSRRFDRPPTPKNFLTHVLSVLGELA